MTRPLPNQIFKYEFIETFTGRVLGHMSVRADRVELRRAPLGAWTSTRDLTDILEGGVDGGLTFAFPDQGAEEPSYGRNVKFESMYGAAYGSLDGKTINLGCINGMVEGFASGNSLMVLTFTPNGLDWPSYGSSATTMRNDAIPGGTGIIQRSENPEEHADKYVYFGTWTLVEE